MDRRQLLLIEDDQTIAELLAYNLRRAGYEVLCESDGPSGLETALTSNIDLALIDIMLPGMDGMSVSEAIVSAKPTLPIIMVTARSEREMMLRGYEHGADDYIIKPFDLDELLARVAARLRRAVPAGPDIPVPEYAGLTLDKDTHVLSSPSGEVFLKPKEYDLLALLLSQPGHLFRREEIVRRVWNQQYMGSSRTLDVHIRHLRTRLESVCAAVTIQNVRGVGYRVADLDEAQAG